MQDYSEPEAKKRQSKFFYVCCLCFFGTIFQYQCQGKNEAVRWQEKTAASKRAILPRAADYTKKFLKDWNRVSRSGRYDMHRLKEAMMLLSRNDAPLGQEWLDHALAGNWAGLS